MVAWLVTWESIDGFEKVAAVLSYRLSPRRVREYVEQLYVDAHYSLRERLNYAKDKRSTPYPAEYDVVDGVRWEGRIMCGHNPWLYARLVDDLAVTNEAGEERLTWVERKRPDLSCERR